MIGAGAAGLSAALVLGRARRRTLARRRRRAEQPGRRGRRRLPRRRRHGSRRFLRALPGRAREIPGGQLSRRVDRRRQGHRRRLRAHDRGRRAVSARCVLLATGMDYRAPRVPGIDERWGRSVFHCPFCHGWEVRDGALGVLDSGESGVHRALLLRSWSDDVTLYTNGNGVEAAPTAETGRRRGIASTIGRCSSCRATGDGLAAIRFRDGSERRCDGTARTGHACISDRSWRRGWARQLAEPTPARRGCGRRGRDGRDDRSRPLRGRRPERTDAVGRQRRRIGLERGGRDRSAPDGSASLLLTPAIPSSQRRPSRMRACTWPLRTRRKTR